jgi:L-arabinokinase
VIALYISGHGFGHASRDVEVLNALGRLAPDVLVAVRTAAPRWLFDLTLTRPVDFHAVECDTGVVQLDSLSLDERETMARATAFHATLDRRASDEASWLRASGARVVVGDIPPLACAAAAAAGVPAIALGNFTWDWIYDGYRDALPAGSDLIERLGAAYAQAEAALRLPMHGGFSTIRGVRDLPFIARRSGRDPRETRRALGLPLDSPLVLLSFGGYGLQRIDLGVAAGLRDYTIVLTADVTANRRGDNGDASVPDKITKARRHDGTKGSTGLPGNVRMLDERALYAGGYRYEDLVAAVDVVMTKPGYGIIAECVANGTAIVYTSRGRFVEYDVLVREMPRWLRCGFISNEDLLAGAWQAVLDETLGQPPPPERIGVDGAERAAEFVLRYL